MNDNNDIGNSTKITHGTVDVPKVKPLPEPQSVNVGNDLVTTNIGTNDSSQDSSENNNHQKNNDTVDNEIKSEELPKTKWYYLYPTNLAAVSFIAFIGWLHFFGDEFISEIKENNSFWSDIAAYAGASAGLIGGYIAALAEINPKTFGYLKPTGAIIRFFGALVAFAALYVALIFLA